MIFLLICVLSISIFININLFNKYVKLDKIINDKLKIEDRAYNTIYAILKIINSTKNEMDKIDHRGSFKSDDEVGFTFKALHTCIDTLAEELNNIATNSDGEKSEA